MKNILKNGSLILIVLITLSSCDTLNYIPLTDSGDTLNVKFECDEVNISLVNWQGHVFDFYQEFNLNESVTLFKDSLIIIYNDKLIPCYFVGQEDSIKITVREKSFVRTAFQIESKINKGDTIKVNPAGYIYCGNKRINFNRLTLIIQEDLRGPFGS